MAAVDLDKDTVVCEIISRLSHCSADDGPIKVDGTWGSFAPMLSAHICRKLKRPVLYVCGHIDAADNAADDLGVFSGKPVEIFPVWEGGQEHADPADEVGSHRMRIAMGLAHAARDRDDLSELMISTSVQALNQPIPRPQFVEQGGLALSVNETMEPELVVEWLYDNGFERVDSVDVPGQFAHRGGIVDIFASVTTDTAGGLGKSFLREPEPVRVEFFGDTIESIRRINLDTQRSSEQIDSLNVIMPGGHERLEQTELFINLLPADTVIIIDEPTEVA
ncbi:MAG: hypothetical protein KAS23_04265, partial [Anaerohalosphaera sp.]|nr:hypothetical protein [Anaerohalosphaera sp.]